MCRHGPNVHLFNLSFSPFIPACLPTCLSACLPCLTSLSLPISYYLHSPRCPPFQFVMFTFAICPSLPPSLSAYLPTCRPPLSCLSVLISYYLYGSVCYFFNLCFSSIIFYHQLTCLISYLPNYLVVLLALLLCSYILLSLKTLMLAI